MENIEKSAAQWQELVSEKDKEINKKDREIADLRKQVDWFKGQFKLLQSKQFGPSSEKSVELEEQLSLFNEPELFADPFLLEQLSAPIETCLPWGQAAQALYR